MSARTERINRRAGRYASVQGFLEGARQRSVREQMETQARLRAAEEEARMQLLITRLGRDSQ